MDLYEVLDQVVALLRQRGRVTYRALKRQFALEDDVLEGLKAELFFAYPQVGADEGQGSVGRGEASPDAETREVSASSWSARVQTPQSPVTYPPPHLAERILTEQAAMEARGASEGERKTITALFADLKGSTALIEGL